MTDFFEDLGDERVDIPRIKPSREFVKAKLKSVELTKLKERDAVTFTFVNEADEIFTQNILEPFNEGSTPEQRANNIDKIMHLYGAFIKDEEIVKVTVGKGTREMKKVFEDLRNANVRDIVSIHEFLVKRFHKNWVNLPVTLKIVYINNTKNPNNIIQFPLYLPFIHSQLSYKNPVETWKWNDLYDFETPQATVSKKKTDREDDGDAKTFNHADADGEEDDLKF